MDDTREIINELDSMLKKAATAEIVTQLIAAYDSFAQAAMCELLTRGGVRAGKECALAERAWVIADAMMVERKKRGLGGTGK